MTLDPNPEAQNVQQTEVLRQKIVDDNAALSRLIKRRVISTGRNTQVIECGHKTDKSLTLALKCRQKKGMTHKERQIADTELRTMQMLMQHRIPGIVKIYSAVETEEQYNLVTECCQSNLHKERHQAGCHFSEEEVCNQALTPLLKALAFLHSKQIVHRDVRLENLLLGEEGVKLTGFGLCVDLDRAEGSSDIVHQDSHAPEMIWHQAQASSEASSSDVAPTYDEKVDVWAAGVVAYELLFGHTPFHSENHEETERLITETSLPGFMGFLSTDCQDFLQQALRKKSSERPSAESLLSHPWLAHHSISQQTKAADSYKGGPLGSFPPALHAPIPTFVSPNCSLSPRMGSWKIPSKINETPAELVSSDSDASAAMLAQIDLNPLPAESNREGAEDIVPRSPLRRQSSWSSRGSSVLSYVEAAPQLEELREEAAESSLHPVVSPDLVHLNSLGSSEAHAVPNLLPSIKHVRRQGSLGKSRFS